MSKKESFKRPCQPSNRQIWINQVQPTLIERLRKIQSSNAQFTTELPKPIFLAVSLPVVRVGLQRVWKNFQQAWLLVSHVIIVCRYLATRIFTRQWTPEIRRPHGLNDNKCPYFKLFCVLLQTNMHKRDFNSLDLQVLLTLKIWLRDNSKEKVKLIIPKLVCALFSIILGFCARTHGRPVSSICDFCFYEIKLIFTTQKSCTFVPQTLIIRTEQVHGRTPVICGKISITSVASRLKRSTASKQQSKARSEIKQT